MTTRWALLVAPAANRVYAAATPDLLCAETRVLDDCVLGGRLHDVAVEDLAGVPYVTFAGDDLTETDLARLGTLSTGYALFGREGESLRPVALPRLAHLDDDLLTIHKYAGKTNELFTRMLLNLTLWAGAAGADLVPGATRERPIRVLDPMCGRGTTLHQALVYGCDADGLEVDPKDFDAHEAFLKTWLRRKRLKHTADVTPIRREGERLGRRLDVALATDKEAWKAGEVRRVAVVQADTRRAGDFFKAGSYDALVTDAPYGVQHGARSSGGLDRGPQQLLEEALPGWVRLLRPGGALGLSWNTRVAPRQQVVDLLGEVGLEPYDEGPWRGFEHRVDQAIQRDVLVARKPG